MVGPFGKSGQKQFNHGRRKLSVFKDNPKKKMEKMNEFKVVKNGWILWLNNENYKFPDAIRFNGIEYYFLHWSLDDLNKNFKHHIVQMVKIWLFWHIIRKRKWKRKTFSR